MMRVSMMLLLPLGSFLFKTYTRWMISQDDFDAWNALMRPLQSYSRNCLLVTLLLLKVQATRTLYRFSSKPDSSVPLQHICLIIQTMSITCIFHFYTTELFSLLKSRNPDRSVSVNQNVRLRQTAFENYLTNWGKQKLTYHAVNDFNNLDPDCFNSKSLLDFKQKLFNL